MISLRFYTIFDSDTVIRQEVVDDSLIDIFNNVNIDTVNGKYILNKYTLDRLINRCSNYPKVVDVFKWLKNIEKSDKLNQSLFYCDFKKLE